MIGSADEQGSAGETGAFVRGNHLPMWIYERRTLRFLEVSDGAVRLYGYTRDEFLEMTARDIGPMHDATTLEYLDPEPVNGSSSMGLTGVKMARGSLWA